MKNILNLINVILFITALIIQIKLKLYIKNNSDKKVVDIEEKIIKMSNTLNILYIFIAILTLVISLINIYL